MQIAKRNLFGLPQLTNFFDDDWFKIKSLKQDWPAAINVVDNEKNYEVEVVAPGLKRMILTLVSKMAYCALAVKQKPKMRKRKKTMLEKNIVRVLFHASLPCPTIRMKKVLRQTTTMVF